MLCVFIQQCLELLDGSVLEHANCSFGFFEDTGHFGRAELFDVPHNDNVLVILFELLQSLLYGSDLELKMQGIFEGRLMAGNIRFMKTLNIDGGFFGPVMVNDLIAGNLVEQARKGEPPMLIACYVLPCV